MRVMVIVMGSESTEAGAMPSEEMLAAMGRYNEELVKAGIMLAGEGLHPSSKGKRIEFSGTKTTVVDGPFTESKELIAGYWLWQVDSMDQAVEWARRCPNPTGGPGALELRPIHEDDDLGAAFTPELRAHDARLRAEIARKNPR